MKLIITLLCLLTLLNSASAKNMDAKLEIKKLTEGLYQHTSYKYIKEYGLISSNGLIVVKNNNATIIDTPWKPEDTLELLTWLEQQKLTVKASISTHFHDDRSSGISLLNQRNIPTYASTMTNTLLAEHNKTPATLSINMLAPVIVHDNIEVYYPGAGHTPDNIVVWLPEHKTLYGGCLLRALSWKGIGNIEDADIKAWPNSIDNLLNKYAAAERVIPGHGKNGNIEILHHTLNVIKNHQQKQ